MITKQELEDALAKVASDMQQLVANYNVLQGQHSTLSALIAKFAPGITEIAHGAVDVVSGIGEIASGAAEVVAEVAP